MYILFEGLNLSYRRVGMLIHGGWALFVPVLSWIIIPVRIHIAVECVISIVSAFGAA